MVTRRAALLGLSATTLALPSARAAPDRVVRIGIIQDASGTNSALAGVNSIHCARMAAEEVLATDGIRTEILNADHQNKPDIGMSIARQWLDSGVDAMLEFNNSVVALAVNALMRERDRVMLANNVGSSILHGRECTANTTHWVFDTAMLSRCLANSLYDQGGATWFFIRRDDVFGRNLFEETGAIVKGRGGTVLGEVATPLGTTDYSSALLLAQASGAKVIALALAGNDLLNCIKQANEFGLMRGGQRVGSLLLYEQDIRALGLEATQGTLLVNSFYWNLDDRTRAFSKRVMAGTGGQPPNMGQAGAYAAVKHYLKAAASLGVDAAKASGRAAVARMKAMPVDGEVFANASIRADGRVVSDA